MIFSWFKGRENTHYYCPECGEELYEWAEDFYPSEEEGKILIVDWLCIFCFCEGVSRAEYLRMD